MKRLSLPQVTLVCVDTTPRLPWAIKAMQRSMAQVDFGDAILCTSTQRLRQMGLTAPARVVDIGELESIEAYSAFMIKGLTPLIRTSHLLVVQWDGFVLSAPMWCNDFLSYDYIGAPWTHEQGEAAVGNGGFSLRSKRLLEALRADDIIPHHPEDVTICKSYRPVLEQRGIRFAPVAVAERFSIEDGPLGLDTFGFHGLFHLPHLLSEAELVEFLDRLESHCALSWAMGNLLRELSARLQVLDPQCALAQAAERFMTRVLETVRDGGSLSPQALGLCKALIRYRQYSAAGQLLQHRREAANSTLQDWRLHVRLVAMRLGDGLRRLA